MGLRPVSAASSRRPAAAASCSRRAGLPFWPRPRLGGVRRRFGRRTMAFGCRGRRRFRVRDRNGLGRVGRASAVFVAGAGFATATLGRLRPAPPRVRSFGLWAAAALRVCFALPARGSRVGGSGRHMVGREIALEPAQHIAAFGIVREGRREIGSVRPAMQAEKRKRLMTCPVHASGSRPIPMKSAKALTFGEMTRLVPARPHGTAAPSERTASAPLT